MADIKSRFVLLGKAALIRFFLATFACPKRLPFFLRPIHVLDICMPPSHLSDNPDLDYSGEHAAPGERSIQRPASMDLHKTQPIQALRQGDQGVLHQWYRLYRAPFFAFARKRYGSNEADAADAFQEALIAIYESVVDGRLKQLTHQPKALLFRIASNKLIDQLRKRKRERLVAEHEDFGWESDSALGERSPSTQAHKDLEASIEAIQLGRTNDVDAIHGEGLTGQPASTAWSNPERSVMRVLQQLDPRCRKLLQWVYYQRLTMATVAARMGWKGPEVARVHKHRCMQKAIKTARA